MASKRFVKPLKAKLEPIVIKTNAQTLLDREKLWKDEYQYCLIQAKREHPDWTLKQRQEYARNSANSLFE